MLDFRPWGGAPEHGDRTLGSSLWSLQSSCRDLVRAGKCCLPRELESSRGPGASRGSLGVSPVRSSGFCVHEADILHLPFPRLWTLWPCPGRTSCDSSSLYFHPPRFSHQMSLQTKTLHGPSLSSQRLREAGGSARGLGLPSILASLWLPSTAPHWWPAGPGPSRSRSRSRGRLAVPLHPGSGRW